MEHDTQTPKEVSKESKDAAIKAFALVGFIAVIFIGLWVLVQAVRYAPNAFSTLASIAESIYVVDEDLSVSTEKNVVNSGDAFVISWTEMRHEGTYTFAYECVEGVSAEMRDTEGSITPLTCGSSTILGSDIYDLDVVFSSEKRRFVDIPYTVGFKRESRDVISSSNLITVVNASITQSSDIARENGEEEETTEEETAPDTTPTTPQTRVVPETVTTIPVSDPRGFTDLAVTYLGVGLLNDDNEFTPRGTLDNDARGAVRFEVKNIGTKTSSEWEFEAELPTSPVLTYSSPEQDELKPNERAIITVGFSPNEAGARPIEVTITGGGDTNTRNNTFDWTVTVTN